MPTFQQPFEKSQSDKPFVWETIKGASTNETLSGKQIIRTFVVNQSHPEDADAVIRQAINKNQVIGTEGSENVDIDFTIRDNAHGYIPLDQIQVSPFAEGGDFCKARLTYNTKIDFSKANLFDEIWRFSITSDREKITSVRETDDIAHYPASADIGLAVMPHMERGDGIEIFAPKWQMTVSKGIDESNLSHMLAVCSYAQNKTNSTTSNENGSWMSFSPNSVLFMGAEFHKERYRKWRVEIQFLIKNNDHDVEITLDGNDYIINPTRKTTQDFSDIELIQHAESMGLSIPQEDESYSGTATPVFMNPWDHLAFGWEEEDPDTDGVEPKHTRKSAHVASPYGEYDFTNLGLKGPYFNGESPEEYATTRGESNPEETNLEDDLRYFEKMRIGELVDMDYVRGSGIYDDWVPPEIEGDYD